MKSLILNSIIVILLLSSCTASRYSGLKFLEQDTPIVLKKPFDIDTSAVKFKSEINLYNNYMTGMLLVKRETPDILRTILITETGIKIFDLSIEKDSWTVNYSIEAINRRDLFELISADMNLLFYDYLQGHKALIHNDIEKGIDIIKVIGNSVNIYYYINPSSKRITRIESSKGANPDIIVHYAYSDEMELDSVRIEHDKFDIELNLIILKDE